MATPPSDSPNADVRAYDECYYARYRGRPYRRDAEWLAIFDVIAERIATEIQPRRVLDAGCALGLLVETLRDRGIEAFGVDVSTFAIDHVYEPIKLFCRQGSAADPLGEHYDLIVCIEVLEHMSAAEAEMAVANFCAHSDDILFSSSPFEFGEATHTNVRPPEYWAGLFARHGFLRDVDFDASFICSWAVRFRRRTEPLHRIVADYERNFARMAIERNELRAAAVGIQTEIARLTKGWEDAEMRERATRDELAATRDELAATRAERDDVGMRERSTRAEHEALADRQRATQAERDVLMDALTQDRATIDRIQRSLFWRARRPWAWISRRLGRPT